MKTINKELSDLNYTIDQMDSQTFTEHPFQQLQNLTFFSLAHGTLPRIYHMLGFKTSLKIF
jgi:hypothetical protein